MPLSEELASVRTTLHAALPASVFQAIAGSIETLKATGVAEGAAGIGETIRLPVLVGVDGAPIDLLAISAGRPVVLLFYRGSWCPYCDVTLLAYAKALPGIDAAGATLIAVTPETAAPPAHSALSQDLGFPIAIDQGNRFARNLGLVFSLPEDLRPLHREIGIDLPARNGDESHELPIPATYVLDASGRVAWAHVDADFTTRADPADVLRALETIGDPASGTSRAA